MSASFLTATLCIRPKSDGDLGQWPPRPQIDVEAGYAALEQIEDLEWAKTIFEDHLDGHSDIEPQAEEFKLDDQALLVLARRTCRQWIADLNEIFESSEEISSRWIGGYLVVFTGGMSWGDAPTDAAETMWNIQDLPDPVLEALGIVIDPSGPPAVETTVTHPASWTDTEVVNAIAVGLGTQEEWTGSDCLEWIADVIGKVRPHPGNTPAPQYLEQFMQMTDIDPRVDRRLSGYVSDDPEIDEVEVSADERGI